MSLHVSKDSHCHVAGSVCVCVCMHACMHACTYGVRVHVHTQLACGLLSEIIVLFSVLCEQCGSCVAAVFPHSSPPCHMPS
jgi:hypothetical protein